MAYRRKHVSQRSLTFVEDLERSSLSSRPFDADESPSPSLSVAAHPTRASVAHRDFSSLCNANGFSSRCDPKHLRRSATYTAPKGSVTYEYTSMRSLNESKYGFWGVLARKTKTILDDDNAYQQFEDHGSNRSQMLETSSGSQGGLTKVENTAAGIIQETRKLHIRRKSTSSIAHNQAADFSAPNSFYPDLNDHETQLKASRDVANAMAAKAKLLLRELKTVKADLAFSTERCAQLEEENKLLRESLDKGDLLEDDDLIRLQLETLLEEKGRLAHENSICARENRFLREIVEYHQLTMQDIIYVDEEGIEEVSPIHPRLSRHNSSVGRLSPIISRPGSSNPSNNTSPQSFHANEDDEEIVTGAYVAVFSTSPSSPLLISAPAAVPIETTEESSPLHSSHHGGGGLRSQCSLPSGSTIS